MNKANEYFVKSARQSAMFLDHQLTVEENKERFGRSYDRATMWYSLLHKKPVRSFTKEDYHACFYQWNTMIALGEMVGTVEFEDGTSEDRLLLAQQYVDKTFEVMKAMFRINSNAVTEEDKLGFIRDCLSKFQRSTTSETLHKASCRILKLSFTDLRNDGNGWYFDSRKAKTGTMRWILTAEDGISRLLQEMGKEQVVINMNTANFEKTEEQAEQNRMSKEMMFRDGVVDIASGKRYLCSAPSASSTRHVDFPFVNANLPEEVYEIWCEITGFSNLDDLVNGLGHRNPDGSISMVFAKFKARIAQNGANSLSLGKTASERVRERLRNARVAFVPDCKGTIDKPFMKISSLGVLSMDHEDGTVTYEEV